MALRQYDRQWDTLPENLQATLSRAYGTGGWTECRRTPKGSSNICFFVTSPSGRYVLRLSNSRKDLESLRFEIRLIEFLRARGYPAPELMGGSAGLGYVVQDGTFCLLTRFIEGDPYDPTNLRHLLEAGRGLGLYHRLVKDFPGPCYERRIAGLEELGPLGVHRLDELDSFSTEFLSPSDRLILRDAVLQVKGQFSAVARELAAIYPRMDRRVIQGSFGRSALIYEGDRLKGVVDYDRATLEVRGMDLAYTVKAFCRGHAGEDESFRIGFDLDRCRELMGAYREEESLSEVEIPALPLLFRAQRLRKVLNKCENFLAKNLEVRQEEKDVRKLATVVEREAARLSWLEAKAGDLIEALSG